MKLKQNACAKQSSESKYIQMTTEPVEKLILKLAVPTIISMLVTAFYNLADTFFIRQLKSDKTRLIMNKRCAEMFGLGEVMANGDNLQIAEDFNVEAVPAYNTTEGHLQFHPKGRDNGYLITLDGLRIYIAGDTEDIPEMENIKDIDIAFLPCNQPYTMTTEQLANAAKTIKPKVLFPYHYGQTNVTTLPEELKADGIDVRIRHYE